MSVKNSGHNSAKGEVIRAGILRKLKTTRKKWFVLRAETPESSAKLEYYDNEKKFKNGVPPKRSIPLKTCFNINKRTDTKYKHVIALYTKDDCFCIILDNEEEQEIWLKDLLSLLHGEESPVGEQPRRWFEHVWQVGVLNRGLGTGIVGKYRLCLTDKTLSLIKKDGSSSIDLNLSNIRTCGSCQNFFCLEIGRSSQLGAGELWMLSEDFNIAHNMFTTIYDAMKGSKKEPQPEDLTPKSRTRSSSATEASKPNIFHRKQVMSGVPKAHVFAQEPHVTPTLVATSSTNTIAATTTAQQPTATGGFGNVISHQRTQSLPLTDHHTIFTPPTPTSSADSKTPTNPTQQQPPPLSRVGSVASGTSFSAAAAALSTKRINQSTAKCPFSGRERCDSMPSRPRTTSETAHHSISMWKHLTPHRSHGRDISHSPPSGSPVSPPSVGCSTDSTGSSYSLADEQDICMECPDSGIRYSGPLTPDEAIAEEDCPESPCGMYNSDYVLMGPQSSDDGCYMDMSPRCRHDHHHHNIHSPTASLSSVTSGTPSTDMRFSDYPLDKASSYFTATEDDARPARAYSVGSRPETYRSKRHVELPGTPEDSRVRAFSVGSKTKKVPCRVLPPHHHGIKSSSAPILSNSRSHSSHSSLGPMDDLMEMDFSRSNTGSSTNSESANLHTNVNKTTTSGYVEMKPGVEIKRKISVTAPEVSSYMDMSGGAYMDMSGSSPSRQNMLFPQQEEYSPFMIDINRQYRLQTNDQPQNNNYLDMEHRSRTVSNSSGSHTYNDDYLDMSGSQNRLAQQTSISASPNKSDFTPLSFIQQDSNKGYETVSKTSDGYVEMTLGNQKNQKQPIISTTSIQSDDSMLGGAKKKTSSMNTAKKTVSQPITITQTTSSSQVTKNSSSPLSISSLLGRKSSTNTPPKMHLPLTSPYSSLPRQRNRKNSQSSKDNSSSSSVTTPSSSSTIFPLSLNSPSSPLRQQTKTETPSSLKLPSAIFSAIYKGSNKLPQHSKPTTTNEGYTVMDFEHLKPKTKDTSEYVNYAPAVTSTVTTLVTPVSVVTQAPIVTPEIDDYALMEPAVSETAKVTTFPAKSVSSDGVTSPLITHLLSIAIQENQSMMFRPIKEDSKMSGSSPTPDFVSRKPEGLRQCSSSSSSTESPYETLRTSECVSPAAKISRPNSVSSDTVKTTSPRISDTNRPASVSSDTSRGATSRPSSTSSEQWSSSSTLVSSRPESVNSDAIHSDSMGSQSSVLTGAGATSGTATETKIHYASLDLAQNQDDEISRSPTAVKGSQGESLSQEPPSIYAKIDFVVSEGLKQNNQSLPNNAKVKH